MIYENVELENYNRIDWSKINSEMTDGERRFVHGLIRHHKPKRLLELGVSSGGGTVNMLNAISDDSKASLTSVDLAEKWYKNKELAVGADVGKIFPELCKEKWKLFTGADVSQVIHSLNEKFDFAVIDTAHVHPVESINFLCALPYLKDGAVVVFHDISLFYMRGYERTYLATRILISALMSKKIFPSNKDCHYISESEPICNICAVTITPELRKYIDNCFIALSIPWEIYPAGVISDIRSLLEMHYNDEQLALFDDADRANLAWVISNGTTYSTKKLERGLRWLPADTVFYGAGEKMSQLLQLYRQCGLTFDSPIWDKNANKINAIAGHVVRLPDFETKGSGKTVVIAIFDEIIANSVGRKLESIGYTCICVNELFGFPLHDRA